MTTFAKELDRIVCQHTVKARWAEDFIPVLNALYDIAIHGKRIRRTSDGRAVSG